MSMNLHVYAGPYVECRGDPADSWGDISAAMNEALFLAPGLPATAPACWLPNKGDHGRTWDKDTAGGNPLTANYGDIVSAADRFVRQFVDALKILDKQYGADNVGVRWGVVAYHM